MPRLLLNQGSSGLREIILKPGRNTIGRVDTNDFPIPDPSVSSHHCDIEVAADKVIIRDNNSTNGTYIDQQAVTVAELKTGQNIRLGAVSMVYQADAPAQQFTVMVQPPPIASPQPPPPPASLVKPVQLAPASAPPPPPQPARAPSAPTTAPDEGPPPPALGISITRPSTPAPPPKPSPAPPVRISIPAKTSESRPQDPSGTGTAPAPSAAAAVAPAPPATMPQPAPLSKNTAVRIVIPTAKTAQKSEAPAAPFQTAPPAAPALQSSAPDSAPRAQAISVPPAAAPSLTIPRPAAAPAISVAAPPPPPDIPITQPAIPVARPAVPIAQPAVPVAQPAIKVARAVTLPVSAPIALPNPEIAPLAAPGGVPPSMIETSESCRSHPKIPANYWCAKCQRFYCTSCVNALRGHHACRRCGQECEPVRYVARQDTSTGFWGRLPGAFLYPFRGGGIMLLLVGLGVFTLLKVGQLVLTTLGVTVDKNGDVQIGLRSLLASIVLIVVAGGYLFSFLQNVLHSTASDDPEMPDLPSPANFAEDLVMPFLRLLGLLAICFGPATALLIWSMNTESGAVHLATLASIIFGLIYFPMAFLAVAILDSLPAANPLAVVSSMFKVPLEYFIALLMFGAWIGSQLLGDFVVRQAFPDGLDTKSMAQLFLMLGTRLIWAFFNFYLVVVAVRILGTIFSTRKERLGWI